MDQERVEHWRRELVAVNRVSAKPPKWLIPHLLVPGLTIVSGPPKVYKSFLMLWIIASILHKRPVGQASKGRIATKSGPVVYCAKEQRAGRIRHIYETRVLNKALDEGRALWDFAMMRDPWRWRIDEPEEGFNMIEFIRDWKPLVFVLDPFVYFHQLDENDPHIVFVVEPLMREMAKIGGSLIIVHHNRKKSGQNPGKATFDDMRGTSALFGMVDGAIMMDKMRSGSISVQCVWKDYREESFVWRPK